MTGPRIILLLLGILAACLAPLKAAEMENGIALITTSKGKVTLTADSGITTASLHQRIELTGVEIICERDEHIFLALSNGTALGIYEGSRVRIEHYKQLPFAASRESTEYEPSRSKLVIELLEGSITFSANRISPLSEFTLRFPRGSIRIHEAAGRVVLDRLGDQLHISSGIVSYHYPTADKEEEFVNSPNAVRITGLAETGAVSLSPLKEPFLQDDLTKLLVKATHRSRERVAYKVPEGMTAIPEAVLVATPESLEQPTPRPYRYID